MNGSPTSLLTTRLLATLLLATADLRDRDSRQTKSLMRHQVGATQDLWTTAPIETQDLLDVESKETGHLK